MAFGKDPNQLANIPSFGGGATLAQQARAATQRPERRKKGGSGAFYWRNCYSPPSHQPDIIRLLPGAYTQTVVYALEDGTPFTEQATLPFVLFREHHTGKKSCVCSAGPFFRSKTEALPCPSCTIYWEDYREQQAKKERGDQTKGPNRMSLRDRFAFNVWDYGIYFEMPSIGQDGQYRMNPKTNQPYTDWVKGNSNDPKFQGRPWKQGALLAWPMPPTYKDTILAYNKQIGLSCKSCGSRDSIHCLMKLCSSCGAPVYDPNNSPLTQEQRDKLDTEPFSCPQCRQVGFIAELLSCSACQQPQRATVFDVDLQVQRVGDPGRQTFLQIFSYSDPRPLQVDAATLEKIKPLDLLRKFAPTPPDVQNKLFGLPWGQPAAAVAQPNVGQAMAYPAGGIQMGSQFMPPNSNNMPPQGTPHQ